LTRVGSASPASAEGTHGQSDPSDVGARGRVFRLFLTAAAAAFLLYGTVAGHDDNFPFGPFTMYALYFPPNTVISSTTVEAHTADGRTVVVTQADTGVSHADLELELASFEADPGRLGELAATFHRRFPVAPPYVEVWIDQTRWQLHDRGVVDRSLVRLVDWRAS
jgi:hypothetical protein